jgi:hypothetical protein
VNFQRPPYLTDQEWQEFLDQQAKLGRGGSPPPGGLPVVVIRVGEIERVVNETETALIAAQDKAHVDHRLFRRGNQIVAIGFSADPTHDGKTIETQVIVPVEDYALLERIASAIVFMKFDGRKKALVRCDPPKEVAVTLRQRGYRMRLPPLVAVVNCPQFKANGQIMDKPGYDADTGIYYDPRGAVFPPVPAHPTKDQAATALKRILSLYETFDFETENDRAVAVSLVLTLIARTGISFAPLHAFDAPTAGSGKSKLVDIANILATGHEAGVIAQGHTSEEFEKRLSTQLMKGKQLIAIDNCSKEIEGDLLNQCLTQITVEMRVLGQSRDVVARCATVLSANGNNLVIVGDATRRSLIARLDPKVERPELRQLTYDPIVDTKGNRGELVVAALTILKAYRLAGKPGLLPKLQNFDEWSDAVRSAMTWLGLADPVTTQERLRKNDPLLTNLVRVAATWGAVIGCVEARTASEAVADAETRISSGTYENQKTELVHQDLHEAFMAVAGRGGRISTEALGKYLSGSAYRVITVEVRGTTRQVRFERKGDRQGVAVWGLSEVLLKHL